MNVLVNESLNENLSVEDYFQLKFSGEAIVSVFTSFEARPGPSNNLIGKTVASVSEDSEHVILNFGEHGRLVIDIRETAFVGPEAITLLKPGFDFTVWQ